MKTATLIGAALLATATTADAGQYVITTKYSDSRMQERLQQWLPSLKFKRRMADERRWVIQLPDDKRAQWIEALQATGLIRAVEEDIHVTAQYVPADTMLGEQWGLFSTAAGINALPAWDIADGEGAVIAVADTGYIPHPDLDGNRLPGYDMISSSSAARDGNGRDGDALDEGDYTTYWQCGYTSASSWHGAHVAGIANAVTDNGSGIAGVAPGAKFVPVRVLGSCGGSLSDIADGVIWSAGLNVAGLPQNNHPADVINLSLGGAGSCPSFMQDAINAATAAGSVVVVAAGNENVNASGSVPANCQNVVTVAAVGVDGSRASYSNYGSVVDIAAPGGGNGDGILSTIDSGSQGRIGASYAKYQGTSMAAPHVAGIVALMRSANPALTPDEIADILTNTARPFAGTCDGCGSGVADALAAVAVAAGTSIITPDEPEQPEAPVTETVTYGGDTTMGLNDASRYFWFFTRPGTTAVSLNVGNTGSSAAVSVMINHASHNELSVVLTAPDGRQTAMTRTSVAGQSGTYQATGTGQPGNYVLTITDRSPGNAGTLRHFSVTQDEVQ